MFTQFSSLANRKRFYLSAALVCFSASVAKAQTITPGVGRFKTSSSNARARIEQTLHGKTVVISQDKIVYDPGILKPFTLSTNGGLLNQPLRFTLDAKSTKSYNIALAVNGMDSKEYVANPSLCTLTVGSPCSFNVVYVHDPDASSRTTFAKLSATITDAEDSKISMTLPDIDLSGTDQTLVNQAKATTGFSPKIFFNPTNFFETVAGDSSLPQTVTITTQDPIGYTISTTALSGADATDFSVTNCVGARLDRDSQKCELTVAYSAKAAKRSAAQLTVTLIPDNQPTSTPAAAEITISLSGMAYSSCTGTPGYAAYQAHHFFPLNHKGIDDTTINCYYNTASNLAFLTSAAYQYNPAGSANTVTGDLASAQFAGGIQLTLAGSATTSSCSQATTTTSSSANSSCSGSASSPVPSTTAPSLEQDIQSLTQGGDFAIKILWPIYNIRAKRVQYSSILNPRLGFTVNGISATATTANATEVNAYITNENYFQIDGIPAHNGGDSPASLFFDYRWGLEYVGQGFASTAMLPNNKFLLQQISAGLVIGGSIRISGERYVGPSQVYVDSSGATATTNNFGNWQLRVQFTPSSVATR